VLLGITLLTLSLPPLSAQSVTFTGSQPSVNFGNVNLCAAGQTTPAPCNKTLTLNYKVTESGTLGAIKVVTGGDPNLDFTLASGSTCTGSVTQGNTCTVNVKFTPIYAGTRPGAVQLTDDTGKVLITTFVYGFGAGPQLGFNPGTIVPVQLDTNAVALGFPEGYFYDDVYGENTIANAAGDLLVSLELYSNDPLTDVNVIVELPADGGPQKTLCSMVGSFPGNMAVDGAGDLFIEKIKVPAGCGAPVTLPFPSGQNFGSQDIAVDGAGDVFYMQEETLSGAPGQVFELAAGSETAVVLPFHWTTGTGPSGLAVDGAGDVFASDNFESLLELPAGGGPQKTVTTNPIGGFAVDPLGDVFSGRAGPFMVEEFPAGGGSPVTFKGIYTADGVVGPSGDFLAYGPDGNLLGATRELRLQPPPLNFGVIAVGTTTTQPLTITNTGTGTLTATPSFDDSSYTILSETPANCLAGIAPVAQCTLQIEFAPTTVASHNAVLTLTSNTANLPTASVALQGGDTLPAPVLSVPSGVYAAGQSVSITDAAPDAAIYYTTDGSTPTASSHLYGGPISITSTRRLSAVAILGDVPSAAATAAYTIASPVSPSSVIDFHQGFTKTALKLNGTAALTGTALQLTTGAAYQAGSAFYSTPVNVQAFATDFAFQLTNPDADGFTFTIQNAGTTALGKSADSLGYAGIEKSVAVKFDLHSNAGEGPDSTGLYLNGATPTVPAIDLSSTGINLHSGDIILAQITYDGVHLNLTLTDTVTLATASHSFTVNIPGVVGNTAYVGFTGGTGEQSSTQQILSWTYVAATNVTSTPSSTPLSSAPVPTYPNGFDAPGLITNGSATHSGTSLQLTDGGYHEAGSAYFATPVNIQSFTTDFAFVIPDYSAADGFTFTIQNTSVHALGASGSGLGYANIGKSVAVKVDFYNPAPIESPYEPDTTQTTGLYVDGESPATYTLFINAVPLLFGTTQAHITYDGTDLKLTLSDLYPEYSFPPAVDSYTFPIDIPATVGANTAYVGFTAGTGRLTSTQDILNWTFTNP
jgi:hypothetical protein